MAQQLNQFVQAPIVGMLDMKFNWNTKSAEIDASQVGSLAQGQAVKIVDSAGGIPKVVGCTADTDEVFGFINYDIKSQLFVAGDRVEISQKGNVMFLVATAAVARGAQVVLDTAGGVYPAALGSGKCLVGFALDKATAPGDIIRVELSVPSFAVAP